MKRLTGRTVPSTWVILYYHDIPAAQRQQFAQQMDTLVRLAKPIAIDAKVPFPAGGRYVSVTFDDGFESFIDIAIHELRERRIPCTVFVIAGALGHSLGWDSSPEKVMSVDQLRQLPTDLVTIGSHTTTHPRLPDLPEQAARAEISGSREILEQLLQRRIMLFSFPYGSFKKHMFEWCREAGYERIYTTLPYLAKSDQFEFVTGRVRVDPSDWRLELYLKVSGAYRWLPWAIAMKKQLRRRPSVPTSVRQV